MIAASPRPSLSADLGAADLLRALALAGDDVARQQEYAALLGFDYCPQPPAAPVRSAVNLGSAAPTTDDHRSDAYATLSIRHRVRLFGLLAPVVQQDLPAPLTLPQAVAGLSQADCEPRLPLATVQLHPLVPPGRLWPALKRLIQTVGEGALDVPHLSRQLAQARLPARLPRRPLMRTADRVVVVLDRARHLAPLAPDMSLVAAELARMTQHSGWLAYAVDGHPGRVLAQWGGASADSLLTVDAPSAYPPYYGALPVFKGARVILVSDLGAARRSPSAGSIGAWQGWLADLARAGSSVCIVSPLSGASLNLPGVHSLAGGRLQRLRARRGGLSGALRLALERLKTALAFAVQVEPELLRALRLADPALAPYPELESLYLQDEEVSRSRSAVLTAEAAGRLRPALGSWPVAAQRRLLHGLRAYHAGDYRAVEVTEILTWEAHASEQARQAETEPVHFAQDWAARFEQERAAAPNSPAVRAFGNSVWGRVRQDAIMRARYSHWLTPLWALDEARRREPPPPGLAEADVAEVLGKPAAPLLPCYLVQQGDSLLIQPGPATRGQFLLAGPFQARSLRLEQSGQAGTHFLSGQAITLTSLSAGPIDIALDRQSLRIGELEVPWWALEAGRDRQGAYCLAPSFSSDPQRHALPLPTSPKWLSKQQAAWQTWIDATGPYVDLQLGSVTQRLRWIPPGEFLMGSLEDESVRWKSEGPQHRVIFTEGYWLADTACTQALWQAVMGNNPSRFQDDSENPVEQVSWHKVKDFLWQLGRLAGMKAELPSEAQWEYACRAGTETPFWWGADLDSNKANFNGHFPYAQGDKGEYRGRTVPVKSFTPNPWGLWQMHGNVWEWCRDGRRDYQESVAVNPEGPLEAEGDRALRGGSWFSFGRNLRAADRDGSGPGYRLDDIGFRFLLSSLQPEARRA